MPFFAAVSYLFDSAVYHTEAKINIDRERVSEKAQKKHNFIEERHVYISNFKTQIYT